jgi:hypothetical protein
VDCFRDAYTCYYAGNKRIRFIIAGTYLIATGCQEQKAKPSLCVGSSGFRGSGLGIGKTDCNSRQNGSGWVKYHSSKTAGGGCLTVEPLAEQQEKHHHYERRPVEASPALALI